MRIYENKKSICHVFNSYFCNIYSISNIISMKPGLGDKIESFTKATGIKKIVDTVSQGLNIPCGCEKRKNVLNKMFPGK